MGPGLKRPDELAGQLVAGFDVDVLAGVQGRLQPLPVREVLLRPPDVLVDLAAIPSDLVVVVEEPRDVFHAVLRGLRGEVPEALEDLHANPAAQALRVGVHELTQGRVEVLARLPVAEDVHEALVVEPGRAERDPVLGEPDQLGQEGVRVAHAVAHPHHPGRGQPRPRPHAPRHHGHGVRVVEEQGIRAPLGHVVGHLDHHRDGSEAAHDAADADRVGDGLTDPVFPGDIEVGQGCLVATDLDLVDHVVGAVQGGPTRRVCGHRVVGAGSPDELLRRAVRVAEPLCVDVVQRDLQGAVELLIGAEVGEDAPREFDATRPHDGHLRHERKASIGFRAGGSS